MFEEFGQKFKGKLSWGWYLQELAPSWTLPAPKIPHRIYWRMMNVSSLQRGYRSSARKLWKLIFPLQKKVNYRALGTCLLFITSNKVTTFDFGSSLAQRLFPTTPILQLNKLRCGEGTGLSHLLPVSCLRKMVFPTPILPTIPEKCTQGDAASPRDEASWGHSPLWPGNQWQWAQLVPGGATWVRRIIPGAKHSLGFCQSL